MSEERDPTLLSLFDAAREDLADDDFASTVVESVKSRRRRLLVERAVVVALLVMLELMLESPIRNSLGNAAELLFTTLYPLDNEWLEFIFAPVNSVAGILGLLLLFLHYLYRRLVL